MDFDSRNYYEILEIETNATLEEIRNAYKRAKNAYSGDSVALYSLMSQDECDAIVNQIEEAYSVIGDPEKRREYDNARGLNQNQTEQGFKENLNSTPSYTPKKAATEMMSETSTESNNVNQSGDFQYNAEHSNKSEVQVSKISAFNKFKLNFSSDEELEQRIENCTEYTGDFLKKIREYKNVTVERMADMTKISKTYIRNIEDEDYSKLPADVYTRGFVYQYAKCLKLNPDLVATSYIHRLKELKNPTQTT
tara:strand:+ start:40167 stop:40919 length:753 start_codon:yes stop_codon:yes gene_type:complete